MKTLRSLVVAVVVVLMALLVLVYLRGPVLASTQPGPSCPAVELECLPINEKVAHLDDFERMLLAGAEPCEVTSLAAIASGNIGKGPLDVIDWSERTDDYRSGWWDFGYYHLAYRPGHDNVLGVGIRMGDPDWLDWTLAVLYADRADYHFALQLEEWRRKVRPAMAPARRSGCRRDCLAVVGAIANSSPTLARRLGERTGWDPHEMLAHYATTPHRGRRAEWLRREVL